MDSTYAPRSPDLSNLLSSPSKTQQHYHPQPSPSSTTTYAPRSPVIPSFNNPAVAAPTSQHNLHNSYQHSNQPSHSPFGGENTYRHPPSQQPDASIADYDSYGNTQYMPPIPALPPQHSFEPQVGFQSQQQNFGPSYYQSQPQTQPPQNQYIPTYNTPNSFNSASIANISPFPNQPLAHSTPDSSTMSSRGPRGNKASNTFPSAPPPQYKDPNPLNIEIRTKFPVARIKRIMQADEEVGKVAQVTPVAVSKALELFMIALVTGAADKAKEKGGKRVTAQHLKQVVLGSPEQFDFLAEIVGRVAEVTEGAGGESRKKAGKVKEEGSESSEEEEKKKVKKGKGRRKKSEE